MIVPGSANSLLLAQGAVSPAYNLTKSVRFRSGSNAYLNRTLTSSTNRRISTFSAWIKRGTLSSGYPEIISAAPNGSTYKDALYFTNTDNLYVMFNGGVSYSLTTSQVFRDPSSWYHIVLAIDTTQSTASNRVKLYVNGVQVTAFSTANYPTQNYDPNINSAIVHNIGRSTDANDYFDGYMTEINFIDGQALTPSSFGENNATTGVWQPKQYTGTYGTNGFYLKFTDVATTSGSNAGLGKDFSGNGNYWNTNNISVTAGVGYDSMTDVPTLTSATTANYSVINSLANPNGSISSVINGNLYFSYSASSGNANKMSVINTIGMTSGKWYWEVTEGSPANGFLGITTGITLGGGGNGTYYAASGGGANGSSAATYSGTALSTTAGDVVGLAFDADARTLAIYKNNTLQGTFSGIESGKTWFTLNAPVTSNTGSYESINFGQQGFAYTPPTGYVALNTYNLPTSTIVAGNKVMDATTYTGNGTGQAITNTAAFKPDLVWIKCRSNAYDNDLFDSVRGPLKILVSNNTNAEDTQAAGKTLTAFNSNGFQLGTDNSSSGSTNNTGWTYVGWQWQAGQGTTSSNTNGSITSTVSVNATAGFSVATFTMPGSGTATVGHGLGVAPSFIVVKSRTNTYNWRCYHTSVGNTGALTLNSTAATATDIAYWNNTSPTSSVFTMGTTFNGGGDFVAYCWAEIAGFSKFGSFSGNGTTDNAFIYTGFRPKFVLIKRTDSTSNWFLLDSSRSPYNVTNALLRPNLADAEVTATNMDFLSNGVKLRDAGFGSGETYIYAAFAENPFKNALAR